MCRGIFGVGRIFVFCYDVSDYWDSEFRVRQLTVNAPTLRHLNLASMRFNDDCQYLPDAFSCPACSKPFPWINSVILTQALGGSYYSFPSVL